MASLRNLAGQTAIYGVSSIIGRVVTFLLTPLYTRLFPAGEYGIITELYAYVAFLIVLLTFGMETAFFRFGSQASSSLERDRFYSTAAISVGTISLVFLTLVWAFQESFAISLGYPDDLIYIQYFALIVAFDAIVTIPLARLRMLNKPFPFASINLLSIFINIGLNLFFLVYCPYALSQTEAFGHAVITGYYDPSFGIGYIFLANVISSALKLICLLPFLAPVMLGFVPKAFSQLFRYSYPLLILGFAGICNETFDRAFYKDLSPLPDSLAEIELGIYGACYKVAMLLSIGIQAYRFAAEPFLFAQVKGLQRDEGQSRIMRYYFIVALFIALSIVVYLDIALLLIGPEFRTGAGVVPILLLAYVFFGAVFNLSFWYKLNDKTWYGAGIAIAGALVTILANVVLIPIYGFYGSAMATALAYALMLWVSYSLSQKHHPIHYPIKSIFIYLGIAVIIGLASIYIEVDGMLNYVFSSLLLCVYLLIVVWVEKRNFPDGLPAKLLKVIQLKF